MHASRCTPLARTASAYTDVFTLYDAIYYSFLCVALICAVGSCHDGRSAYFFGVAVSCSAGFLFSGSHLAAAIELCQAGRYGAGGGGGR